MQMESIVVTTIAGSGEYGIRDGVGTAASFNTVEEICYSEASGSLLVAEAEYACIRRLYPATQSRKSELMRVLGLSLIEAVPIQPLISIIFDFAIGDSTYAAYALCVFETFELPWTERSFC